MSWLCSEQPHSHIRAHPRIIFVDEHIPPLLEKTKIRTTRVQPATRTKQSYEDSIGCWIRCMRNWQSESQIGWLYIRDVVEETVGTMPNSAPSQEGYGFMSVSAFKEKFFKCTCKDSSIQCAECKKSSIAVYFDFLPLQTSSPYPPRRPTGTHTSIHEMHSITRMYAHTLTNDCTH